VGGGWALGKDGAEREDTAGRRKGFVTAGNGEATRGARETARWFLRLLSADMCFLIRGGGGELGGRTRWSRSASRVRPQSSAFPPPCSMTCRVRPHDAVTSGPRRGHVRATTRSRPGHDAVTSGPRRRGAGRRDRRPRAGGARAQTRGCATAPPPAQGAARVSGAARGAGRGRARPLLPPY